MTCDICNDKISNKDVNFDPAIKDGAVCSCCAKICGNHKTRTVGKLKSFWEENARRAALFQQTRRLAGNGFIRSADTVTIDETNRLFYVGRSKRPVYFSLSEVREFGLAQVSSHVKSKFEGSEVDSFGTLLTFGWGIALIESVLSATSRKVKSSQAIPIFMFRIKLNSFYGKGAVLLSKPPKGLEEFLEVLKCSD